MSKYVHRPLCPFKPGDHIRWKDDDGYFLKKGHIYDVKAVDGPWFNVEGCRVTWGYDSTQFEVVK